MCRETLLKHHLEQPRLLRQLCTLLTRGWFAVGDRFGELYWVERMRELGLAELGTVVTYNPWTVPDETPLAEMVRMLAEADFRHWPVVDSDQRLNGIVSAGDVVRALEEFATAVAFRGDPVGSFAELQRRCVADVMTRRPLTIDQHASLATILQVLHDYAIDALPVLEEQELIGLVTRSDILREFSYGQWPGAREAVMDTLEAAADPIESDASLEDAALALRLTSASYLGVVRAGFPIGVISDRDVRGARCRATLQRFPDQSWHLPGATTVRELAAQAPTIRPSSRLAQAATMLLDHHRRATAVINQAGRLLGAVTEDGILRRLTERLSQP